jgi:hypothetical protein
MTDLTDQQRDAVEWLKVFVHGGALPPSATYAQVLLEALPDALTNPQPAMPTEPGIYSDRLGQAWQLGLEQDWSLAGQEKTETAEGARLNGPFRRLAPERRQITLLEIALAYQDATGDYMIDDGIKAIADLINGTPA